MGTTNNISSSSSRINYMLGLGDLTPIIHDTNKRCESPQTPDTAGVFIECLGFPNTSNHDASQEFISWERSFTLTSLKSSADIT